MLIALAEKLPDEKLFPELLAAARQIESESSRADLLIDLAPRLSSQMPLNELFPLWKDTLHLLSRKKRQDLQPDIAALTAVIFKLGGKEAMLELASAIQDVGKWWK
ncbi:MAG: hypothetical protein VKL59_21795 [Nostocaceae cyanobacterium]|nr:hypothetical protein [Nostocaceae cyanobacterium]